MHILLFILAFVFVFILIIFALFRKVISFLFGGLLGDKNKQQYANNTNGHYSQNQGSSANTQTNDSKVFSKNEGEYVSYEDIE